MKKERYNRLLDIMWVQSHSYDEIPMREFIGNYLEKMDGLTVLRDSGNYYITKGKAKAYPCIVAHIDTVHKIERDYALWTDEAVTKMWAATKDGKTGRGIGGDDKVGIFVALECLRHFDNIKVALFSQEEIGCVGSGKAKMDWFDDVAYALQCDRRGNKEVIENGCGTELFGMAFENAIKPIMDARGYKTAWGSLTDVVTLKENGLNVACANIACGYYEPHTYKEYIVLKDVDNCLGLVMDIVETVGEVKMEHEYTPASFGSRWNDWDYEYIPRSWGGVGYNFDKRDDEEEAESDVYGIYDDGLDDIADDGYYTSRYEPHDDCKVLGECYHCTSYVVEDTSWGDEPFCMGCIEYLKEGEYWEYSGDEKQP